MPLVEVPASWPHHESRHFWIESVFLSLRAREVQLPFDRIGEVDLPVDQVCPGRRVLASSKSAMKTLAPEFSALITILRSVGPVISTRRSPRSSAGGTTFHSDSRTDRVSARKVGDSPASRRAWRSSRSRSSSNLRPPNSRWRLATNSSASSVSTSEARPVTGPLSFRSVEAIASQSTRRPAARRERFGDQGPPGSATGPTRAQSA